MDTSQTKNRLLLVDGDPKSLRVLDVSLKKAGFDVTTAANAHAALATLETTLPDLIISDTDLEEIDGFELCNRIKARTDWAKIPFLFVSSRKSIEDKIRGLELGVDDYLTKPIYIKEIGIRVRTALQRAERERMESKRDGRTRFAGALSDVGVVDLVQTIELNRKSGIIHIVNRDDRRGSIFFRDGKVIDAEVGRLSGAHALYRMFSWSDGQFAVEFKHIRRHDVVDLTMAALLMEGMRRLDESTHLLETLPSANHALEVDCRVLAEELAELPDEMNSVLRLCDGARTLQEVVEDSDLPDLETLTIISKLYLGQIVFARETPAHGAEPQAGVRLANWLSEGAAEEPPITPEPREIPSAATLPSSKPLLPGPTTFPAGVDQPLSAEETLGAALPSCDEAAPDPAAEETRSGTTLKGLVVDRLFPEEQAPLTSPPPAFASSAPGEEPRPTAPMGLAERLLSADSALHAATMHEVMAEAAGSLADPATANRQTHGYGDSAALAAAIVQDVVSATPTTAPTASPPPQPERPAREVDWGAWPALPGRPLPPLVDGAAVRPIPVPPPPTPIAAEPASPSAAAPEGEIQELSRVDVLPEEPNSSSQLAEDVSAAPAESDSAAPAPGLTSADRSDPGALAISAPDRAPPEEELHAAGPPILVPPAARMTLVPPHRAQERAEAPPLRSPPSSGSPSSDTLQVLRESSQKGRLWLMIIAAFGLGVVGVLALGRRNADQNDAQPVVILDKSAAGEQPSPSSPSPLPPPSPPPSPAAELPLGVGVTQEEATARPATPSPAARAPAHATQPATPTMPAAADTAAALRQKCLDTNAGGKGKAKAVVIACRPLLEMVPTDAEILVILARAEIDRGRLAEARSLAKKALATDPERLDAYVYLGTAEQAAGRPDEARAAYKKYLELSPDGPFSRELRAILSNL